MFCTCLSEFLQWFTPSPMFLRFPFMTSEKFLSLERNKRIPGFFWCFSLLRSRLRLVRWFSLVLLAKNCILFSYVRPLKMVLMNRTSDCGLINVYFLSECPHRLDWWILVFWGFHIDGHVVSYMKHLPYETWQFSILSFIKDMWVGGLQ